MDAYGQSPNDYPSDEELGLDSEEAVSVNSAFKAYIILRGLRHASREGTQSLRREWTRHLDLIDEILGTNPTDKGSHDVLLTTYQRGENSHMFTEHEHGGIGNAT